MRTIGDKLDVDSDDVSWFVRELQAIREHYISEEGWQALREGTYLGGNTASQRRKCGPGGLGLVCPQLPQDEWEQARTVINTQHRQQKNEENLDAIERERREMHIDEFIKKAFPEASEYKVDHVCLVIDRFASTDNWTGLEALLLDARNRGWAAAERRVDPDVPWSAESRTRLVFMAVVAILELLLALGAYRSVDTPFERIVICLLLLSYARISDRSMNIALQQRFNFAVTAKRFTRVFRLLRDRPSKLWRIDEWAFEEDQQIAKANAHNIIGQLKYLLLELMAACGLIWAIL